MPLSENTKEAAPAVSYSSAAQAAGVSSGTASETASAAVSTHAQIRFPGLAFVIFIILSCFCGASARRPAGPLPCFRVHCRAAS